MHVREWDLVEYGVKHAKRGTKARGRAPWRYHGGRVGVPGVTLQEVIEEARRLYPDLSIKPATARKWIERSLLPNPTVEARGEGKGTVLIIQTTRPHRWRWLHTCRTADSLKDR